ncbi:hypothetical protein SCB71_04790 [Herbiconiux sp. KACC 21604]|uniref:hypothetical protein n=1 Tax=unclassified Herbiconiux TaxID=2618217 RepID=UPI0014919D80|nr:hypothetical protein [Herbiconiux sp. SALV-R1]QJU52668.1 hypothetical protein HL652_02765 [Herbiconiux sp. SALV-R1]WPO87564.1 hypothetical protein SCB71_04790 [Herbiconiux sp. KACC 21604]
MSSRTPRRRPRWLVRTAAAVAIGAVVAGGSVVASPPQSAQASWQGDTSTWINGLNSSLSGVSEVFGKKLGPLNIALSFAVPIISSIFGDGGGGKDPGPGIQDVLDKLNELDDIENRLDVMQEKLAQIESEVLKVDIDTLMGTCTVQTAPLKDYLAKVRASQTDYENVLTEIDRLREEKSGDKNRLKAYVDAFIKSTLGATDQYSVNSSAMALSITTVHERMVSGGGGSGVIQDCGTAYLAQWRFAHTASGQAQAVTADQAGAWVDDRQYYEPLQNLVQYWQIAQTQGVFLLQQAALMQATKQYVKQSGQHVLPADASAVCSRALSTEKAPNAAVVCDTSLRYSKGFYTDIVNEWRQVGVPFSDDKVMMSLGTEVTGVQKTVTVYDATTQKFTDTNVSTVSRLWVRDPAASGVPWQWGTWATTGAAATSYAGFSGFVPAGSAQWGDLVGGYEVSHPGVKPEVMTPRESFPELRDTYAASNVPAYAPTDIIAAMSTAKSSAETSADPATTPTVFAASGIDMVWMPGQKASWNFSFVKAGGLGAIGGLDFPPSSLVRPDAPNRLYFGSEGLAIKCFVARGDGALCTSGTPGSGATAGSTLDPNVGSWFIGRQATGWGVVDGGGGFEIHPVNENMDQFYGYSESPSQCDGSGCLYKIDTMYQQPRWLAPFTLKDGSVVEGDPSTEATLWPVAPMPAECGKTSWGAPTRCGAQLDAWLKANIPNPAVSGPVLTAQSVVTPVDNAGTVTCPTPTWQPPATTETGVPIVTSQATWAGWVSNTQSAKATAAVGAPFVLGDLAKEWTPKPKSFSVVCTYTARYADLANVTVVTSKAASAIFENGVYRLGLTGAPGDPGSPTPGPGQPGEPAAGGSNTLAATGAAPAGWIGAAGLVLLLGAALAVGARVRMRARARSRG